MGKQPLSHASDAAGEQFRFGYASNISWMLSNDLTELPKKEQLVRTKIEMGPN